MSRTHNSIQNKGSTWRQYKCSEVYFSFCRCGGVDEDVTKFYLFSSILCYSVLDIYSRYCILSPTATADVDTDSRFSVKMWRIEDYKQSHCCSPYLEQGVYFTPKLSYSCAWRIYRKVLWICFNFCAIFTLNCLRKGPFHLKHKTINPNHNPQLWQG